MSYGQYSDFEFYTTDGGGQLTDSRVVLFGSRARKTHDEQSDYDLLIIRPNTLTPREKIDVNTRIDRAIVESINIPVDLLINSDEEISEKRELPGHIIRSAIKEGIFLLTSVKSNVF